MTVDPGVPVRRRVIAGLVAMLVPGALAAQGLPDWFAVDTAGRTVSLTLQAEAGGPDGIAALNGLHHGSAQVVVPLNWTVKWAWVNRDSLQSHSLVVMAEREKLPQEGGRPALENALSRAVLVGLKPGQRDLTTFVADQAGWYWLLCGVPSHAIRGEWIGLKVDRDATLPALVLRTPS
ncbi:MAG: sulfocyanin-like copper-binding protein [Gemmatimonadota bacterium]|nr:sulfocyanin-like copper-binding protein [Gemmatimonadota bacterium]